MNHPAFPERGALGEVQYARLATFASHETGSTFVIARRLLQGLTLATVWHTPIPESTLGDGIAWTCASPCAGLFAIPEKFTFQLGNAIQPGVSGTIVLKSPLALPTEEHHPALVHAIFCASTNVGPPAQTGWRNSGHYWIRFVRKDAHGSSSNTISTSLINLPDSTTLGKGSFRGTRLLVNGQPSVVCGIYRGIRCGCLVVSRLCLFVPFLTDSFIIILGRFILWGIHCPTPVLYEDPDVHFSCFDLPTSHTNLLTDEKPHNVTSRH